MVKDPSQRMSLEDALAHCWLRTNFYDELSASERERFDDSVRKSEYRASEEEICCWPPVGGAHSLVHTSNSASASSCCANAAFIKVGHQMLRDPVEGNLCQSKQEKITNRRVPHVLSPPVAGPLATDAHNLRPRNTLRAISRFDKEYAGLGSEKKLK